VRGDPRQACIRDRKDRQESVTDEFQDFTAMGGNRSSLSIEEDIENFDHPLAGQPVRPRRESAQIGRPEYGGDRVALAAAKP